MIYMFLSNQFKYYVLLSITQGIFSEFYSVKMEFVTIPLSLQLRYARGCKGSSAIVCFLEVMAIYSSCY